MTEESIDTKTCPFCAETIKAAAIVCKHCGRDLPAQTIAAGKNSEALAALGFSGDSLLDEEAKALGVSYSDGRYTWRGNHFRDMAAAVAFAKANPTIVLKPIFEGLPPAEQAESARFPVFKVIGVCIVAFVGIALVFGSSESNSQKVAARRVIELCWQDHDRKSLDPETKRFIAGVCETKEREFVTRYGHNP